MLPKWLFCEKGNFISKLEDTFCCHRQAEDCSRAPVTPKWRDEGLRSGHDVLPKWLFCQNGNFISKLDEKFCCRKAAEYCSQSRLSQISLMKVSKVGMMCCQNDYFSKKEISSRSLMTNFVAMDQLNIAVELPCPKKPWWRSQKYAACLAKMIIWSKWKTFFFAYRRQNYHNSVFR